MFKLIALVIILYLIFDTLLDFIIPGYLIYDIEAVLTLHPETLEKGDKLLMIGFYDSKTKKYDYCIAPNFRKFKRLAKQRPIVIGFNSESFDDRICHENGITVKTTYDIYRLVREAAKLQAGHREIKGYNLDTLGKVNFGEGKLKDGRNIIELWTSGDQEGLINYCLQDVRITVLLWQNRRKLVDPNSQVILNLQKLIDQKSKNA